jgi:hypothetical protein
MIIKKTISLCFLLVCFLTTLLSFQCSSKEDIRQKKGSYVSKKVSDLVHKFGLKNNNIDKSAFDEAIALGPEAIDQLKEEFTLTDDIWVQSEICLVITRIGSKEAVPFLINVLENNNSFNFHVSRFVIYALGQLKDKNAIEPLADQIHRPDIRYTVMIKRADEKKSKQLQLMLINDPEHYFPEMTNDLIIRSLANIGGEEVFKKLHRLSLTDSYATYTQKELQRALKKFKKDTI